MADNNKLKSWGNFLLGASLAVFAGFCTYQFTYVAFNGQNYIAKVNGKAITASEFKTRLNKTKNRIIEQRGTNFRTSEGKREFEDLSKQVMEELVYNKIIYQKAYEQGITASQEEVLNALSQIKAQNFRNNENEYKKALKKNDLTEEELLESLHDRIIIQKFFDKLSEEKIDLSEETLKKEYEVRKEFFTSKDTVEASHILVQTEEKANEIYDALMKGESFDKLAKENSLDPGSKDRGGRLGFFGPGMMVPEFEKAAFSLKMNEISKPVKTNFGYHIIQKTGFKPGKVASFQEAKDILKGQLKQNKEREVFEQWRKEVMDESEIVYNPQYAMYNFQSPPVEEQNMEEPQTTEETTSNDKSPSGEEASQEGSETQSTEEAENKE